MLCFGPVPAPMWMCREFGPMEIKQGARTVFAWWIIRKNACNSWHVVQRWLTVIETASFLLSRLLDHSCRSFCLDFRWCFWVCWPARTKSQACASRAAPRRESKGTSMGPKGVIQGWTRCLTSSCESNSRFLSKSFSAFNLLTSVSRPSFSFGCEFDGGMRATRDGLRAYIALRSVCGLQKRNDHQKSCLKSHSVQNVHSPNVSLLCMPEELRYGCIHENLVWIKQSPCGSHFFWEFCRASGILFVFCFFRKLVLSLLANIRPT